MRYAIKISVNFEPLFTAVSLKPMGATEQKRGTKTDVKYHIDALLLSKVRKLTIYALLTLGWVNAPTFYV